MKVQIYILACILTALFTGGCAEQASGQLPVRSEPHVWKSVRITGGGFVDGIVFHPNAPDVRYCRTDMGGAYRWDKEQRQWVSMLDWITYEDSNLVGVESIAVDPADPLGVYLSCGTYTRSSNGAVMISRDGGRTFRRVDMPFTMGGNENGRGNGERMMVDPANTDIIYMGTRLDGLWRSADRGMSWQRVASFPDVSEPSPAGSFPRNQGSGIVFVVFDPATALAGEGCRTIYAGVSLMNRSNLFVSRDAGLSWEALPDQPEAYRPTQACLAKDGALYITYGTNPGPMRMENGAVWKYHTLTGGWEDISPVKPDPAGGLTFGYASVSVDAANPGHLIVSTFGRPLPGRYTEDDIFRSTDGGMTWSSVFGGEVKMDYSLAPYTEFTPLHWMFDIEIDPFDPNHAMFTTGYGGWETFNLADAGKGNAPVRWQIMSTGIEETVPLELYSPAGEGARLISAIGDYGGFTHFDLDKPAPSGSHANPYFGNTNGVAGAEDNPQMVVRVGTVSGHHPGGKPIAYSEDGGQTWLMPLTLPPGERVSNGHIAVSSDGRTWIWTPNRMPAFFTHDKGAGWQPSEGIAPNIRVVADRVDPLRFYGLDRQSGVLYESRDGGEHFSADTVLPPLPQRYGGRGDSRGGQDRVYSVPGREGELWIADYDGLYRRLPGEPLIRLDQVRRMLAFGFGKGSTGDYPALYMIGIVNGVYGFFRSDDVARSWTRINDEAHQYGLVLHITGDPKLYGRVYVGTHGRGILYADPVK
ncbi:MAG: exo-alpha-sialidase [Tannerellaceae bacterium]|nr:exo-alpha-sialidase [Tannerellaceae bacterium]